jgi:uncharacterized protein (DUF4415 family)
MRDEDIDYSDIPPATPEDFARADIRWGIADRVPKKRVTLHMAADVLEWFRARGKGYQMHINLLLRSHMKAHEEKSASRRR